MRSFVRGGGEVLAEGDGRTMHTYSAVFFVAVVVVGLLSLSLSLSASLIVCQSSAVVQHSWEETRRFYLPVSGSSSQPTQIKEKRE